MADFDAQQPVRTTATEFTTEVANAAGTTINPAEDFAQGSTTSGQSGVLVQGAVTTAAPTYTTGQTDPLSLTTAGALRTDGSATTQPVSGTVTANAGTGTFAVNQTQVDGTAVSVNTGNADAGTQRVVIASNQPAIAVTFGVVGTPTYDYATTPSLASGATATHSVAGPITVDAVEASASGELKLTVAWGITGSEVTYMQQFTSASNKNAEWKFPQSIVLASGSSIKLTIKNQDTSAMDVYSSVAWH